MTNNPECTFCPIKDDSRLRSLASRVEKVYFDKVFASSRHKNMIVAEDEIRQGKITADDIGHLTPALEDDINLSLAGCFAVLHESAQADQETLARLTVEQRIAVAGCATYCLRRECE